MLCTHLHPLTGPGALPRYRLKCTLISADNSLTHTLHCCYTHARPLSPAPTHPLLICGAHINQREHLPNPHPSAPICTRAPNLTPYPPQVHHLLNCGAHVNQQDSPSLTHTRSRLYTCPCPCPPTQVHHLLNCGAHVNQRDPRGFTPLHRAAHLAHLDGYLELYEYLLVGM